MTEAENASAENLILLCINHAYEIDDLALVERFPTELLRTWKREQLDATERIQRNWPLTEMEAQEAIQSSFEISVNARNIELGGAGGHGLGAGGGGGGAIGPNAKAGSGGSGGRLELGEGIRDAKHASELLSMLQQIAGSGNFGTGGGGEGVIGPNAEAGNGGSGGNLLLDERWLDVGNYEVLPGVRGEDAIVNQKAEDGSVIQQFIVRSPNAQYARYPETVGRPMTALDIENGLQIRNAFLVESFLVRKGMLDLFHAGWRRYEFHESPFRAIWTLLVDVEFGNSSAHDPIELQVLVRDPDGQCRLLERFDVSTSESEGEVVGFRVLQLNFTGAKSGLWTVSIVGARSELRTLEVRIDCPAPPTESDGGGLIAFAYPISDLDEPT